MVEYSQQMGTQSSDTLTVSASTITYGLGSDDILSTSVDIIEFNSITTEILEINNFHPVAYNTASGQALIILDRQDAVNTIESVQLRDSTLEYNEIRGTPDSDFNQLLAVPHKTIAYGLGGNDTLSTAIGSSGENPSISVLVGGSGDDHYTVNNNSTAIILDAGNSAGDVIVATGIGFNSDTTSIFEIDSRHFVAHDINSKQTLIIVDWKDPVNTIETVQFSEGIFSYEELVNTFRSTGSYKGHISTVEQADVELNGQLSANGITSSSLYGLIATIKHRNALYGGAGNSFLSGLNGNDLLNQAAAANKSTSGDNDTFLVNNTSEDMLIGRLNNHTLIDNFTDEILNSNGGADRFTFNTANQRIDTITDFVVDDTTVVSAADFGGGLTIGAAIPAAEFVTGTATTDPFDRFIYTSNNSNLFLNTDATNSIVGV